MAGLFGAALIVFASVLLQDSLVELTDRKELYIALVFLVIGAGATIGVGCGAFRIPLRKRLAVGLGVSAALCILSVVAARTSVGEMHGRHWFTTNVPFRGMSRDGRWHSARMRQRQLFRIVEDNVAHPEWADEIKQSIPDN
jgi:predicted histidine transporter YuiF (NhaC family)